MFINRKIIELNQFPKKRFVNNILYYINSKMYFWVRNEKVVKKNFQKKIMYFIIQLQTVITFVILKLL